MELRPGATIQMIADYDGDISHLFEDGEGGNVPVLPTRNMVLFPGIIAPILLGRDSSIKLIGHLKDEENMLFAVFCQKNPEKESPSYADLHGVGVFARLLRVLEMPGAGGQVTAIVQGMGRCRLKGITEAKPFLRGDVEAYPEAVPPKRDKEYAAAVASLRRQAAELIQMDDELPDDMRLALANIKADVLSVNFICTNLPLETRDKVRMIKARTMTQRVMDAMKAISREMQLVKIKQNIRLRTREDIDEQQKEYFLQQQIKNIREELGRGEGSPERRELEAKAKGKKWTEEAAKAFKAELDKLDNMNPQSPEYNVQLTWLQTMAALPWGKHTKDDLNIKRAAKVLDRDHYGMEKVKERILEHMAVLQMRSDMKSPIICLYGPPGVGKTSLGRSIAAAMKRKYARVSLGGVHDEAEIRGHRRTYIGAMPGRIIKAIRKAGSANPVFVLDEIDKVGGGSVNGDPASALLEVLDPEQNSAFHDNYLDVDFDISKVMFIATANDIGAIPRPLLDRMELIEVSGYTTEEKMEIARRHLVPRGLEENGFKAAGVKVSFAPAAVEAIIERYTRESGVRQLEKQIAKALRKLAYANVAGDAPAADRVGAADVERLLGKPPFYRDIYQGNDYAGVATGLAWTSVGGEILFIETSLSKGRAAKLTLTGNLGEVMKESAVIALEYIKAHAGQLGVDHRVFDQWNIHIHVPEGATPKDGPSAGITIATSLASALTQRKVRANLAMTGEITLRGKVLPVGGIKEKILAAKRAGITDIVLCGDNRKDIEEIPACYLAGVSFHYVENVGDVLAFALTGEKVDNPVDLSVEEENCGKAE